MLCRNLRARLVNVVLNDSYIVDSDNIIFMFLNMYHFTAKFQ